MHYITQGIIRSCPPAFTHTKILTSTVTRHQNTTSDGDAVSGGGELPGHMLGFFLPSETWGERERIMREEFQRLHHPHIVQHSSSSCQLLCTHTSHFLPCHGLWHSNSRLNGLRHHHWALKYGCDVWGAQCPSGVGWVFKNIEYYSLSWSIWSTCWSMIFDCLWMYSENKSRFAKNYKFVSRMPPLFKVGRKYSETYWHMGKVMQWKYQRKLLYSGQCITTLKSAPGRVMVTVTVMCILHYKYAFS